MPKKRGSSKKGKKGGKDAKKLLEEQLLQRKNSLENVRAGLIQELSKAMTINYRDAEEYEELQEKAEQIKENVTASKYFLQRKLAQYDTDIQNIGNEVKNKTKEAKNLEKAIEIDTAKIEEDYAKIKEELIIAKENLLSKFAFTNVFRLMHRELMESCLKTEQNRIAIEHRSYQVENEIENEGIIQVSQLKAEADKNFGTFLRTATECFEKIMSCKTQNIIRENLTLNRQADQEFKRWMMRKQTIPHYTDAWKFEEVNFGPDRLNRHIAKLQGVLIDLNRVRDLENKKAVPNFSLEAEREIIDNVDENIERQIEKTRNCIIAIESKMESFSGKFNLLRELLTNVFEYTKQLKSLPVKFEQDDYEEIASNIINRISQYDSEFSS